MKEEDIRMYLIAVSDSLFNNSDRKARRQTNKKQTCRSFSRLEPNVLSTIKLNLILRKELGEITDSELGEVLNVLDIIGKEKYNDMNVFN